MLAFYLYVTTASSCDNLHRSSFAGAVIEHHAPYWEQPFSQPYFDNSTRRDMTTTVGQSAYLHCRVRNLGDRAVSWIRKRDLHILTVGILTYTNDQRFQSLHSDGSDEWTLKVSSPQVRDSGTYECQVSTEPKISQAFRLNVVGKLLNCFDLTLSAYLLTVHPFSPFFLCVFLPIACDCTIAVILLCLWSCAFCKKLTRSNIVPLSLQITHLIEKMHDLSCPSCTDSHGPDNSTTVLRFGWYKRTDIPE